MFLISAKNSMGSKFEQQFTNFQEVKSKMQWLEENGWTVSYTHTPVPN